MRPIETILFIRTDRLGDTLMNLPAVHRLRQGYPKSWITWMCARSVAPILQGHPDVDEIYPIDPGRFQSEASYRQKVRSEMRAARFDAAVVANADKHLHWMVFSAGIPIRVGWRRKWAVLLNRTLRDDKADAMRHETRSNLALAGLLTGAAWDGRWDLPVSDAPRERVSARLARDVGPNEPVVLMHPGSSRADKCWPPDRFAELSQRIASKMRMRSILIGSAEAEPAARRIRESAPSVIDWVGATDLAELSALLSHPSVRLLVSADSGPVHVAWLHRKPVVALYAANVVGSDPARWGPVGSGHVVIRKDISSITTDEVFEAVQRSGEGS